MIQRWEHTDHERAHHMAESADGDWLYFDDVAPMLAALSICAWAQVWGHGWALAEIAP